MAYLPKQNRSLLRRFHTVGKPGANKTNVRNLSVRNHDVSKTDVRRFDVRRRGKRQLDAPKCRTGLVNLRGRLPGHPLHTFDLHNLDSHNVDGELPRGSRLQRRLKSNWKRDRIFLNTVRRRRSHLSRLRTVLNRHHSRYKLRQMIVVFAALCITLGGAVWTHLFIREQVTFAGVPYRIVHKFWNDKPARDAYFVGDRQALHGRLKALEIEEDIKAYYREQFPDENELDQYIHQIMFDRTGYVGEAYGVDNFGDLYPIYY